MSRVELVDPSAAHADVQPVLKEVQAAFGTTPAMFRAVANSPAALNMMWAGFGALGGGRLGPQIGEQIAVLVADRNACAYCLAAHTALGRNAGVSSEQMREAQSGRSDDPKTEAILTFVEKVVRHRAQVSDADIETLRAAGVDQGELVEVIANVALNVFTNYINVALDVPVDFPAVPFTAQG